jgi:UDP-N-acetylmuramoyl-tripeptide--D-alanyl-D-alanine ligase
LTTDITVLSYVVQLRASEIAEIVGGQVIGEDVTVDGVQFDSRSDVYGRLFVAIEAERDGHDFVDHAFSRGASCALVSHEIAGTTGTLVRVNDTMRAFSLLAKKVRSTFLASAAVVGVTGSVGKTSTKNLIAGALSSKVVSSSPKSFNNEQGVPFTLLNAMSESEVVVVEMGMRGFGEISSLCEIARPTVGVVTAVGEAHTVRLGGIDGVARAKSELVRAIDADGLAVLNADDERVFAMASICAGSVLTYGMTGDVASTHLEMDEVGRYWFAFSSPWGDGEVALQIPGLHMVQNALAAIAVGGSLNVALESVVAGVEAVAAEDHRMVIHQLEVGSVIIDDCYNANPTSVMAALRTISDLQVSKRIAVLGEMAEVDQAEQAHRAIADAARDLDIEIVAIGTDLYGVPGTQQVPRGVIDALVSGSAGVLVKGSRVVGLERIVEDLLKIQ